MLMYGFAGVSLFSFIKTNPSGAGGMLSHANNIIKYMPIDKDTSDMLTPFLDFTIGKNHPIQEPQNNRIINSGLNAGSWPGQGQGQGQTTKRSVSETKKKYVASQQNWTCKKCNEQLKATFEIDHKIDLQYGGSNHIDNLEALCTECHKDKTMRSNF